MSHPVLQFIGRRALTEFAGRKREIVDGVVHVPLKPTTDTPLPASEVLRAGSVMKKGGIPLPTDIQVDRDVAVKMRDGISLYADVFRPTGGEPAPALIVWSPYGKRKTYSHLVKAPGVKLSGLQKFEGPDPAFWVARGYAVVNVDLRGAYTSEGRLPHWGVQDGRDGYDLTEWVAARDWSNGAVAFTGNSWLSIVQWFIAAERPPHLTAIAPWEGFADAYRHSTVPGGVPRTQFPNIVMSDLRGHSTGEDIGAMASEHPLLDDFWADKIARLDRITVPAYVVASYANKVHTRGTIHAFNGIASPDKWLRIHNTHEWPDYYEQRDDLARFFDHYLLGFDNGWQTTPRVRMSILDPGGHDTVARAEETFPPASARGRDLHLDVGGAALAATTPTRDTAAKLPLADGRSRLSFTHRFETDTEIAGFPMLRFWVELEGCDDADLYVQAEKLDISSNVLPIIVRGAPTSGKNGAPYEWGNGILRLSHRKRDASVVSSGIPQLTHDEIRLVGPGEIVMAEIEIPPMAMRWRAGEQLRIHITGFDPQSPELPIEPRARVHNTGTAVLHTGPSRDGVLTLPVLGAGRSA